MHHGPHPRSLLLHSLCFIISFGTLGSGNSIEIGKIKSGALEIFSYFIARELLGGVEYPGEGIISRRPCSSSGLDKTTMGFQYIVGNTVLGVQGIGV